jgi:predicted transcriptional regulator
MHKRVEREEEEIRRNPEKVSKKIVGAIQNMGVKPDRDVVDKLAAKVITFRRHNSLKEGNDLFNDKRQWPKQFVKRWKSTKTKGIINKQRVRWQVQQCNHEKPAPITRDQRELKWHQ